MQMCSQNIYHYNTMGTMLFVTTIWLFEKEPPYQVILGKALVFEHVSLYDM